MENREAIEIFNKWMDCKDAYQADPSCDGNCLSCEYYASAEEEKEAMQTAISALEKQEADRWIPVTERLPELDTDVLITDQYGDVCKANYVDWCGIERFVSAEESITLEGVIAWKPLPEPYTEEEA